MFLKRATNDNLLETAVSRSVHATNVAYFVLWFVSCAKDELCITFVLHN